MRSTYIRLGLSCPTSRAPNHRLRLQDDRAVSCSLVLSHAIPRGLAGVGAVCRAIPRGQAGVGVGKQHHQGDIEEALAVRRRRAARRGGAARRGSVIFQRQVLQCCFGPGLGPQLQFIDRVDSVRDGVLLVLSSVVRRGRYPQGFLFIRVRDVAVH